MPHLQAAARAHTCSRYARLAFGVVGVLGRPESWIMWARGRVTTAVVEMQCYQYQQDGV